MNKENTSWSPEERERNRVGIEPWTSCFPNEVGEGIIKNDQSLRIPAYPVCFPHLDLRWPMKSKMHVKNISKCFMNVHTPIIDIVYCIYLTSFTPNNHSQIRIDYFQVRKKERERERISQYIFLNQLTHQGNLINRYSVLHPNVVVSGFILTLFVFLPPLDLRADVYQFIMQIFL